MKHRLPSSSASRQRGVVLLFSLVALVVLLIAAVALMRSFNTSMFMSGNIAFKRDLQNQGEKAVDLVLNKFRTGGALADTAARAANSLGNNYSAMTLPVNAQGIPNDLVAATPAFAWAAPVIDGTTDSTLTNQGVSVRYLVDRMCNAAGDEQTLGATNCLLADNPMPSGGSASNLLSPDGKPLCATCKSAAPQGVVYRLSIRVDGPRNTQAFFQSTFTMPSS